MLKEKIDRWFGLGERPKPFRVNIYFTTNGKQSDDDTGFIRLE